MSYPNPFDPSDPDRHAIWDIVVRRDTDFFLSSDWSLVADDYIADGFLGIDAGRQSDPDLWSIGFPTLDDYRKAAVASRLDPAEFSEDLRTSWLRCQHLDRIDIAGNIALAHKRIEGSIARVDSPPLHLAWRSVFFMRLSKGNWKITGFTGYLQRP